MVFHLHALTVSPSGLTHDGLIRLYRYYEHHDRPRFPPQTDSGVRSRCAELVKAGLLRDSGQYEHRGKARFTIWEITPEGKHHA